MTLHVGICGWQRAQDEVLDRVDLMEVQRTFYQPPQVSTAERWRSKAPEGFIFTTKAWQTVTHPASSPTYDRASIEVDGSERDAYGYLRDTEQVREGWKATVAIAEALEAPFVVLQCPPSFEESEETRSNLRTFVEDVDPDARLAWEPRGGWDPGTVADLCGELDLVHVTDPFHRTPLSEGPWYLRLHGRPAEERNYSYTYTDEDLGELLATCEGQEEVWVLFNNQTMLQDAERFQALARERGFEAR